MNIAGKLMQAYFNYAYNPVYDLTTGRLNRYYQLQEICVGKLEPHDIDRVLCVGVGTGNEIIHIFKLNKNVGIVGVDYSRTALQKVHRKALVLGKEIELLIMDARYLQFPTGSFDKVLCIHLMDFVEENEKVTSEILRVLRYGGRFVITYPSEKEGMRLGFNLIKDGINMNSRRNRIKALFEPLLQISVGMVYLPLLFRPKRKSYSRSELGVMFSKLTPRDYQIMEDSVYQDFIVYGEK